MKSKQQLWRNSIFFLKTNSLFVLLFVILLITGSIVLIRISNAKQEVIYIKVKVSQGLWWANTMKPPIWMVDHFQKGDVEYSLTGRKMAEILEVRSYPAMSQASSDEQYAIFITLKVYTGYNKTKGTYIFKRSALAVGAPIDLEFKQVQASGTVTDMSLQPFIPDYTDKKVTLFHPSLSQSEYDQIKIGDTFYDGTATTLTILSKQSSPSSVTMLTDGYFTQSGDHVQSEIEVLMKMEKIHNQWVYSKEQVILPGLELSTHTSQYFFDRFKILHIE